MVDNIVAFFVTAIIGNATILEMLWTCLAVVAMMLHTRAFQLFRKDVANFLAILRIWSKHPESIPLSDAQDYFAGLYIYGDKQWTEFTRLVKQLFFGILGILAMLTPQSTGQANKLLAFIVGFTFIGFECLLVWNSFYNLLNRQRVQVIFRSHYSQGKLLGLVTQYLQGTRIPIEELIVSTYPPEDKLDANDLASTGAGHS